MTTIFQKLDAMLDQDGHEGPIVLGREDWEAFGVACKSICKTFNAPGEPTSYRQHRVMCVEEKAREPTLAETHAARKRLRELKNDSDIIGAALRVAKERGSLETANIIRRLGKAIDVDVDHYERKLSPIKNPPR